jgi:hypothetical protein
MLAAIAVALAALGAPGTPVEWGLVGWSRSWEKTATAARRSGKPILLLFNEVPG